DQPLNLQTTSGPATRRVKIKPEVGVGSAHVASLPRFGGNGRHRWTIFDHPGEKARGKIEKNLSRPSEEDLAGSNAPAGARPTAGLLAGSAGDCGNRRTGRCGH
ncbi:MAG: hypothetical protein QM844_16740, partial [Planctomycetota bacterium]|nr:hypothetical protein [Planctomycetota bacterium]